MHDEHAHIDPAFSFVLHKVIQLESLTTEIKLVLLFVKTQPLVFFGFQHSTVVWLARLCKIPAALT